MKEILALLGVIALTVYMFVQNQGGQSEQPLRKLFDSWKDTHGKHYELTDQNYRYKVFQDNLKTIQQHNQDKTHTYTLGLTKFADLTPQEFAQIYLKLAYKPKNLRVEEDQGLENKVKADVDWVSKGFVTPVKDQGQCGSCWAFSATGALQGLSKSQGTLQSFSQQQLVDCSTSQGNNGCNGGLMDNAFKYVMANGITTQGNYPYSARDGSCRTAGGAFKCSSYVDINNCNTLASAINGQVISVAVDASKWSLYTGGVFNNCASNLNHGVLLVGISDQFWWIKNSWGTGWGQRGFIRLARGNTCGVCSMASYPK